jgi:kojibiose phosphorylase
MTLRAVIFDMDGVLTDTVEAHFRSWQQVCAEYELPFDRRLNEKLLGLTRSRSLAVILNGRELPEDVRQQILKKKNEAFLAMVAQMSAADLLPGVQSLLEGLRQAGLRVGVASGSRNARIVLRQLGVDRYLDGVVDGSQARSKPAPDIFLRAAGLLGVAAWECLAVDDSRAGVASALAAGMCVLGLGPAGRVAEAHAALPSLRGVQVKDLERMYREWRASEVEAAVHSS